MTRKLSSSSKKSRKPRRRRSSKSQFHHSAKANSIEIAKQYHRSGSLLKAGEICQSILNLDPNNAEALHLLGIISYQEGKNENAVDLMSRALDINPDFTDAHSNLGIALHDLGKLDEAVASYRKALDIEPNSPNALGNLGSALRDLGKLDEAVASYRKALDISPNFVGAHNNLGTIIRELGNLDEAVASHRKALDIDPNFASAHNNLGIALRDLGKLDEAAASYRKALDINPNFVNAHNNLGNVFRDLGKLDEAAASYRKALDIDHDFTDAHNNLGVALNNLGKLDEAVASYRKALDIDPDFADAHNNLGVALGELGEQEEAITCHRRATILNPQNDLFWDSLAWTLESISFTSVDDIILQDLLFLLGRPTVHPGYLVRPIISALRCHPGFSQILEAASSGRLEIGIAYRDAVEQLSTIPLFLRIIELIHIDDLEIERMLTFLRHAMLEETMAEKMDEMALPFSAALALHCFTNEYVFSESDKEKVVVEQLQEKIAALLEKEQEVPPSFVAALGAYRPIYSFSWAQELCKRDWAGNIKEVIERQILEPQVERSLRSQIPSLTPIQNAVSQSVREQYEENPYPRWVKTGLAAKDRTVGAVLQGAPFYFDLGDYNSPASPQILVAGCGTGQHAIGTASRLSNEGVLAVDLSLSSLSYASRKTVELGFSNIEYVQGDIMELGDLGRQFDIIECAGVLHHLGDPLAGWRVLVDLMQPGGLMRIGLYSETARQHIISGRSLISEKGYSSTSEDIRRCRQEIIALAEDGNRKMERICTSPDFFSLSNCRDLLFHVQEHHFMLPQIEEALQVLKLEFLGFEMRSQIVMRKFRKSNPNKRSLTSLSLWHKFELENPYTFSRMYQFWCKKM
ncbi:MAG: tetratricopeptide repeat protein [Nitrospinaceae bacterium]|nr:tetratricopeptide repeat protein [Nitrospinaceae bacterium]MBT3820623.1 tetratricopeptide repeat protein [Nitrospinaceae bacterium]MBT5946059.1 tetratricopeptide repeat protein [Nitrospinaceae bacterium]